MRKERWEERGIEGRKEERENVRKQGAKKGR